MSRLNNLKVFRKGEVILEILYYTFSANKTVRQKAHVGVVGSGNLEIILEPVDGTTSQVEIATKFEGNGVIWNALLEKFFLENNCLVNLEINDFGATPGIVNLRLAQALEVANRENG